MKEIDITCEECKHSVDLIKSPDMVYCMKHQKAMFHLTTCKDAKEND